MKSQFLTNTTDVTFLATIQANLRSCKAFYFTVSFIKKAGLVLLGNDIRSALERGAKGKVITSTYQNFTDIESLNFFLHSIILSVISITNVFMMLKVIRHQVFIVRVICLNSKIDQRLL